jgi:sigma-E factor negative regulatory protein RseA
MNEELDSQLSAMFDDELAPAECELLARRLSRDEQLKARWGRYAVIGAAIRSERGVRLNAALARRVNAVVSAEPAYASATAVPGRARGGLRWWQPLAGGALAAGVAAASILWLRAQDASPVLTAALPARAAAVRAAERASPAALDETYVTPKTPVARAMVVPSTQLANYVVAHSMFSSPVTRRNLLSTFMTSDSLAGEPAAAAGTLPPDPNIDVR